MPCPARPASAGSRVPSGPAGYWRLAVAPRIAFACVLVAIPVDLMCSSWQ
ncbi:hypothetical protein [Streptomyces sp. NPDC014793]